MCVFWFKKPKVICQGLKLCFLNPAEIQMSKTFINLNASLKNYFFSESMSGMFSFFRKLHVCVNEFLEAQMGLQVTQEFCWRLKRCWHRPAHSPLLSQGIDPTDWLQPVTFPKPLWGAVWTYVSTKPPELKNRISKCLGLQTHVSTRPLSQANGAKSLQISINCLLTHWKV